MNKMDLLNESQKKLVRELLTSLNSSAKIVATEFGRAPLTTVLTPQAIHDTTGGNEDDDTYEIPTAVSQHAGLIDDHKAAVGNMKKKNIKVYKAGESKKEEKRSEHGHGHEHKHKHGENEEKKEGGHGHGHKHGEKKEGENGHGHGHKHGEKEKKEGENGHGHGHKHGEKEKKEGGHGHGHKHGEKEKKDGEHGHAHGHGHGHEKHDDCDKCKEGDDSHSHSHGHGHGHGHDHKHEKKDDTLAKKRFGIDSFLYTARRPFHPQRLLDALRGLPTAKSLKEEKEFNAMVKADKDAEESQKSFLTPGQASLRRVLRSKGFIWLASHNVLSFYWSHAGAHFELKASGRWWAAMPVEMLGEVGIPDDVRDDFDKEGGGWGDRRQEVVFIGVGLDQPTICKLLDSCLLDDSEMDEYNKSFEEAKKKEAECAKILEKKRLENKDE